MTTTLAVPVCGPAPSRFLPPTPSFTLMRLLGLVNRRVLLDGYCRIERFDFPDGDRRRLADAVNPATAAFLAPNHPEFGLDWLLDKEISRLVAPRVASWAAHGIVASAPTFWRRNNLVSSDGGDAAIEWSVRWALAGHGVLLHPEGAVRWTGDVIQPLFRGVADMAARAARAAGRERPVFIVPIVWKLHYPRDVGAAMHHDIDEIARELGLDEVDGDGVATRLHALHEAALAATIRETGRAVEGHPRGGFFEAEEAFRHSVMATLAAAHRVSPAESDERTLHRVERAISSALEAARGDRSPDARPRREGLERDLLVARAAGRLADVRREHYGARTITQEQMHECLKRLRASLVRRGARNALRNLLPIPYGPRVAHIRVAEPIRVDRELAADPEARAGYVDRLLADLRRRMQAALDGVNREIAGEVRALSRPNPFAVEGACSVQRTLNRAEAYPTRRS